MAIKYFAQTFFVDPNVSPEGVFINSVSLAFKSVDDALPITVQLGPVVSGIPDLNTIYYNAFATAMPKSLVTVSGVGNNIPDFSNTSTYNTFTFKSPIYLPVGEHALVIQTPSTAYELFTADRTQPLLGTNRLVSEVQSVGSYFRPQNTDMWSPDPNLMLTFRLNRCQFRISNPAVIELDDIAPSSNWNVDAFHVTTNDILYGKSSIQYSYKSKDTTGTFDTVPTALQLDQNYFPSTRRQIGSVSNGDFKIFDVLSSPTDYLSPIIDVQKTTWTGISYVINNGELANNLISIIDGGAGFNANGSYTATVDAPSSPLGTQATIAVTFSGGAVSNVYFTNIGSGYYKTPNISIVQAGTTRNCNVQVSGETSQSGGNALARYFTRKVVLADGFDAADLKVWITANRQPGTDIAVYYKVLAALDPDQNFDHRPWVLMSPGPDSSNSVYSQNEQDYVEYTFVPAGALVYPPLNLTYVDAGGYTQKSFKVFAIKICMFSSSTATIPKIKDLRAIALA